MSDKYIPMSEEIRREMEDALDWLERGDNAKELGQDIGSAIGAGIGFGINNRIVVKLSNGKVAKAKAKHLAIGMVIIFIAKRIVRNYEKGQKKVIVTRFLDSRIADLEAQRRAAGL